MRIPGLKFLSLLIAMAFVFGCKSPQDATKEEKGAVIGGLGGAVLGGVIADNTVEGAILGAAIGGLAGAYIGTKMDQQAQEIRNRVPDAQVNRVEEGIRITFDQAGGENYESLDTDAREKLDRLAGVFKEYPNTNILISGHSADIGSRSMNLNSSKNRAQAVADYLVDQGVSRDRLTTTWHGASKPVSEAGTAQARAKNNRVEIAVVANDQLRREAREAAKED